MLSDVRQFGIIVKKYQDFKCQLPTSEISNFFQAAAPVEQSYDLCKDALVHLMTGCSFNVPNQQLFFSYLLGDGIDD